MRNTANIFDKSISTVPATKFSSRAFFQCSISLIKTWFELSVLYMLLCTGIENHLRMFQNALEQTFRKFLRNSLMYWLVCNFLLFHVHSFYKIGLAIGLTDAILAPSENEFFSMSLLIMFVRWESITVAESFIVWGGILSGQVAFFGSTSLIIVFIWFVFEKSI